MSNDQILADLDEIVAKVRGWGDVIRAQREEIRQTQALYRGQADANRLLLNTNLRLKAELEAAEACVARASDLM